MMTMGVKEVLKYMEQEEAKIQELQRKVEILKGYLAKVVCPLDPKHPKKTLNTILREGGGVQLDPFLKACQEWQESLEDRGITIIIGNLKLLHATQETMNKIMAILKQDFSIMDEV